jgi:hypothetical protein
MSIEIEVGLENATRISIPPEEPKKETPEGLANPQPPLVAVHEMLDKFSQRVSGEWQFERNGGA